MRGAINSKGAEGQPCCALIAVVEITQYRINGVLNGLFDR